MKTLLTLILIILVLPLVSKAISADEISEVETNNELLVSNNDLIMTFSIAIVVVIGIFLYLARYSISRKKGEYEKKAFESKKNKDYEKYHSDWTSDETDFDKESKHTKDDEEYEKFLHESSFPNYYRTLGVTKNATHDEIKTQFRRLAKEWHPDKNKQALTEEKMSEINKAYEVLSDKERRKKYDKYFNVT